MIVLRILICIIPNLRIFKVNRNASIKTSDVDKGNKLLNEDTLNETTYETDEDSDENLIFMNKCLYSNE